jgi:hypothetical protein
MTERFETQSVHISNAIWEPKDYTVHKLLNIQVKMNFHQMQNLTDPGPTREEVAADFGKAMEKAFLQLPWIHQDGKRMKIEVSETDDQFGWISLFPRDDC